MKTKFIQYKSDLFNQEGTITINENLNKLRGKVLVPKKLEAPDKALSKLKCGLPK